ncbi:MAG: twin-arginine translocation signal domain-containing protein [Planctomycetes bacterium]|nr:twin-arginine translocation signal domain-containing protein [Planctomycetota bacterium]
MATLDKARNRQTACRRGGLTRRRFLGTAAAAGVLLVTPSQARGYAANEQLQVAVVALGGRGTDVFQIPTHFKGMHTCTGKVS